MEGKKTGEVTALKAHVALNVSDVPKSIEFYQSLFGVEPSKVRTGYAKFDVQNPPLNFTLNQHPASFGGALSHLGIQVGSTEDVDAIRERWQSLGLLPRQEKQVNCCYAIQDKAWVRDPDGNEWEVFVVLQDNLPETTSCCTTTDADKVHISSLSPAASCCG
jgi:catechol 2,3-dioxygenase-like lactoylglutathione lyase family enzyme